MSDNQIAILQKVVAFLDGQFKESPSKLAASVSINYESNQNIDIVINPNSWERRFGGKTKTLFVSWEPGDSHPHLSYINLAFSANRQNIDLTIAYADTLNGNDVEDYAGRIEGNNSKEFMALKAKIVSLYRKIKKYELVAIPEMRKEEMLSAVYNALPELLDMELLGGDIEEGND